MSNQKRVNQERKKLYFINSLLISFPACLVCLEWDGVAFLLLNEFFSRFLKASESVQHVKSVKSQGDRIDRPKFTTNRSLSSLQTHSSKKTGSDMDGELEDRFKEQRFHLKLNIRRPLTPC